MGLSTQKGNGGFLGVDARRFITSSGIISPRKARIERLDGKLAPSGPDTVLFEDNFSSGDFAAGWSRVDENTNNRWMVGQNTFGTGTNPSLRPIPSGSSYAMYVTNEFGSDKENRYDANQQCFVYFDFVVPDGTATLSFDWMCYGENAGSSTSYDYGYIMLTNTSFVPADTNDNTGYPLSGNTGGNYYVRITESQIYASGDLNNGKYNYVRGGGDADNDFIQDKITLGPTNGPTIPSGQSTLWVPGEQRRLIFAWKSDYSVQRQPAWTVANIKLEVD